MKSECSEKGSSVSNFMNKASGAQGYADPEFLQKMERDNAQLRKLRQENKKRIKKFEEIKKDAFKSRTEATNPEYEKRKAEKDKYSNFVRKGKKPGAAAAVAASSTSVKQEAPTSPPPRPEPSPVKISPVDSLDGGVKRHKLISPAKVDSFLNDSIEEQIEVDDALPPDSDDSSDEYVGASKPIPQKLERVEVSKSSKRLSSYEQLAQGVKKPPSAKSSAASRFVERTKSPQLTKLTKESLKELPIAEPEIPNQPSNQDSGKKPQWAQNAKQVSSPVHQQQPRRSQKLPVEATFGKQVQPEFTFGKPGRAPSLQPRRQPAKPMARNKSQSAMKRQPSGAISVISEESKASKQTKLSNLRQKYGRVAQHPPTKIKVRPVIPRGQDPMQHLMERQHSLQRPAPQQSVPHSVKSQAAIKPAKPGGGGVYRGPVVSRGGRPPLSEKVNRKANYGRGGESEASEVVARELNVQEHMMTELRRVNYQEAQVQQELVKLYVQTAQKEKAVLQKFKIHQGYGGKSKDLYEKLMHKPPPKQMAGDQEDELLESINNLDNLLIKNKLKNETELAAKVQEERKRLQRQKQEQEREEERKKAEIERERRENARERARLEELRMELEIKQKQQLKQMQKQEDKSIAALVEAAMPLPAKAMVETPYFNIAAPGGTGGEKEGVDADALSEDGKVKEQEEQQHQEEEQEEVGKKDEGGLVPEPGSGKIVVNPNFNLAELLS